ncbi:AIPR family protein [Lacticaseibacillus porcinae]|uniref:AIPR family protein n=1 Tax=Lacticaseibacillus porcinae TaxID=1123687 RepID=UPI000F7B4C5D|nr:AIPR family protein [Lacticaseibacillus porcinae]
MSSYRDDLISNVVSVAEAEKTTDREAFFQIYTEKLEESEIIEDPIYLHFMGNGRHNRAVQLDGYAYNELDRKLSLFVIPSISYFEEITLGKSDAEMYLKRGQNFYFDADKIIENSEESSDGYGLAFDIVHKKLVIETVEVLVLTDYNKSQALRSIPSETVNGIRCEYGVFDLSRIQLMDQSVNGKEPILIDLAKDFQAEGIPALKASETDDYSAYLCNVPGELLVRIYDKYQSRLLEGNVRSFLQARGKVNKGIRTTILNSPEMFFAYNNGITATAEEMSTKMTPHGLVITGFKSLQIVNGGQTTVSLASAWTNDVARGSHVQISKIFVPMKISVVSSDRAESLIPDISRYANSQNKVSDADLASNHQFHQELELLSRRILAPALGDQQHGTYWYYERANGQYRQATYKATATVKKQFELMNPRNQMFKKVELAKYYNIYRMLPHTASLGAAKSFKNFTDWMLKQWDKNPHFVNEEFYKKVVALTILFRRADTIVRSADWYTSYKANIVAYTLAAIFKQVEVRHISKVIDFEKIWKEQSISVAWREQIATVAPLMYRSLTDPDRGVENVTEWAKREQAWKIAQMVPFDLNPRFIEELVSRSYVETQEQSAVKQKKQDDDMNALIEVYQLGSGFWKEVFEYGQREKIWTMKDMSFLKLAMNLESVKEITDRQAKVIMMLLEKARENSFPK